MQSYPVDFKVSQVRSIETVLVRLSSLNEIRLWHLPGHQCRQAAGVRRATDPALPIVLCLALLPSHSYSRLWKLGEMHTYCRVLIDRRTLRCRRRREDRPSCSLLLFLGSPPVRQSSPQPMRAIFVDPLSGKLRRALHPTYSPRHQHINRKT
jgi:hypothetical protein